MVNVNTLCHYGANGGVWEDIIYLMGDAKGKIIVLRELDQNRKMNRGTYQVHVSYGVGQQHVKLPLTNIYHVLGKILHRLPLLFVWVRESGNHTACTVLTL